MKDIIVSHLKQTLHNFCKTIRHNEFQFFCPYCNDATRKPNPRHGHLYVAIDEDLGFFAYHCFRCGSSGHLISLLLDTGFTDQEILAKLKRRGVVIKTAKLTPPTTVNTPSISSPAVLSPFLEYFYNRTYSYDFWKYRVYPKFDGTACLFYNIFDELVCERHLQTKRFHTYYGFYFFQSPSHIQNGIAITEGPFDAIVAHFWHFPSAFCIAALGKEKITSCLEYLITYFYSWITTAPIVRIILDADVKKWQKYRYILQRIQQQYRVGFKWEILRSAQKDIAAFGILETLEQG